CYRFLAWLLEGAMPGSQLYRQGALHVSTLAAPSGRRHGLPDHIVRLVEEDWGDRQAQSLSSLEVNDQLELHGLLYRQVGRLGAFENLVHIDSSAFEECRMIWSIAHEPARLRKQYVGGDRWQLVLQGELRDVRAMLRHQSIVYQDDGACASCGRRCKCLRDLI